MFISQHISTKALATVVADLKRSSSLWVKQQKLFPGFSDWQIGYGGFTYSNKDKQYLVNYINNQEIHHKKTSFREEYIQLLQEQGIEFDEKYLL